MNANKGAGWDGIRPTDLKRHADILANIVTNIVNQSISKNKMPDDLKHAIVKPIYKGGKKTDIENYRPITILPAIEKVIEEVICTRLMNFSSKYKIINPNHYNYQKGKNINKLLAHFTDTVYDGKSKRMFTLVLFVDFSKAFDTLDHSKIIKLQHENGNWGDSLD